MLTTSAACDTINLCLYRLPHYISRPYLWPRNDIPRCDVVPCILKLKLTLCRHALSAPEHQYNRNLSPTSQLEDIFESAATPAALTPSKDIHRKFLRCLLTRQYPLVDPNILMQSMPLQYATTSLRESLLLCCPHLLLQKIQLIGHQTPAAHFVGATTIQTALQPALQPASAIQTARAIATLIAFLASYRWPATPTMRAIAKVTLIVCPISYP